MLKKSKLLKEELEKIQFSEIAGGNQSPDAVKLDLDLYDGRNTSIGYADVSWTSSAPEIVSPSGYVQCPEAPTSVTVTAHFTFQDYPELHGERSFTVRVLNGGEKRKETALDRNKIRVFIAGDSTACNYPHEGENNRYPQTGWGQVLGELFTDDVLVVNCARSGRSSKSFLAEENFRYICENIQKGDYLFIQFAHNDCKAEDPDRYTSPCDGTYQECIYKYINAARRSEANPVLCTPITRNLPTDTTLVPYCIAVRELGEKESIPVIDLYSVTHRYLEKYGAEKMRGLYKHIQPHDERFSDNPEFKRSQYYDTESKDNTHLNIYGAREIAAIAVEEIKKLSLPLAEYIV